EQPNAPARYICSDRFRHVGAVNSILGAAEIYGAGAERVAFAASGETGEIGLARDHLRGWRPVGPLGLARDCFHAGPGEAFAADTDAIADRFAVAEHVVEVGIRGIDNDSAPRDIGRIIHQLAA